MGEAHVVDPEILGEGHGIAGDLPGVGIEGLGHQGVVADVEEVARGRVLHTGLARENHLGLSSVEGADLELRLRAVDMDRALRTTFIVLVFDGGRTVWCPVGDFFGSGVGLNEFGGWWRSVAAGPTADGSVRARGRGAGGRGVG